MQFSFLGYSVKKIMEFNLDVKDVTILRYFDDFRKSGKMNSEEINGVKYYWISYQSIENELPFLGIGKRSIMMRMFKLRDLGILSHYTKKEGGTFSFYGLGDKYNELVSSNLDNEDSNSNDGINNRSNNISNISSDRENISIDNVVNSNDLENSSNEDVINNAEGVFNNEEAMDELVNLYTNNHKKEEGLFQNNNRGCAEKCTTKTNILNNSSTIVNIYNNIKLSVSSILNYLNSKVGVRYKSSNTKTISLIKARLREGFNFDDFKNVIDKKINDWRGTNFEQYLTPFTLFGDKFEMYLNQKIVNKNNKSYGKDKNLRFHNFKGRDYDYDALEKKLLGWD